MKNLYFPGTLPGLEPRTARVIQDLFDRVNYLTEELDRVRGVAETASPGVDAAKRERPQPGIITIPGIPVDGMVRVNPDGVIVSYVNPIWNPSLVSTGLYSNIDNGDNILNTTTETSVFVNAGSAPGASRTIKANSSKVGTVYHFYMDAAYTTTGTPTIQFRLKLGSVTIGDSTAFNATTGTGNGRIFLWGNIFVDSIGTAASTRVEMWGVLMPVASGTGTPVFFVGSVTTPPTNLTVDQVIDLTLQWGTASASNNFAMLHVFIGKLRG